MLYLSVLLLLTLIGSGSYRLSCLATALIVQYQTFVVSKLFYEILFLVFLSSLAIT